LTITLYLEGGQYKTAGAYTPINLKLNYSPEALKNTDLYAGIDNINDAKIDQVLGSSVGTYVYGGVRVHF
jgi:outer membrane receptor for ferrienterochelin and colicin